jgi:MarR family transcriptional regulator, organic hydroperoxide resistance regulator
MNNDALQACLEREAVHARQTFRLDDELGTQHGLSWDDFVLLHALEEGPLPESQLAERLGLLRSRLLARVLPLQKLGLVERAAGTVRLRPVAKRLLAEARETASAVCTQMAAGVSSGW